MFNITYSKATIRYCEEDPQYANIFSNLAYFISAYNIFMLNTQNSKKIAKALYLVGIGSIALHYLDNQLGQFLDEVYMINLINNIITILSNRNIFSLFYRDLNFIIFMLYNFYRIYSLFLIIFATQIFVSITILFYKSYGNRIVYNDLFKTIFYLIISSCSWYYEQNYCDKNSNIYLLHSFWHITSGISVYYSSKVIKNLNL